MSSSSVFVRKRRLAVLSCPIRLRMQLQIAMHDEALACYTWGNTLQGYLTRKFDPDDKYVNGRSKQTPLGNRCIYPRFC